jgi:hypothetical protein
MPSGKGSSLYLNSWALVSMVTSKWTFQKDSVFRIFAHVDAVLAPPKSFAVTAILQSRTNADCAAHFLCMI